MSTSLAGAAGSPHMKKMESASDVDMQFGGVPGNPSKVIRRNPETGQRQMDWLEWGLLPHDASRPSAGPRPIHARAETVAELAMFADAFRRRRAILPVDAYYQRRTIGIPELRHAISRTDQQPMALEALWESYVWPNKEITRSFCLITIAAVGPVAAIHDRMPLIIDPADLDLWLGDTPGDPAVLLHPPPEGVLQCRPIERRR